MKIRLFYITILSIVLISCSSVKTRYNMKNTNKKNKSLLTTKDTLIDNTVKSSEEESSDTDVQSSLEPKGDINKSLSDFNLFNQYRRRFTDTTYVMIGNDQKAENHELKMSKEYLDALYEFNKEEYDKACKNFRDLFNKPHKDNEELFGA